MTQAQAATGAKTANNQPGRRKLRAIGRKKRAAKLQAEPEFKKAFMEAKSKRANDKKAAFRKKKRGKK